MKHVHAVLRGRKVAEVVDSGCWLQSNDRDVKMLVAEDEDRRTFFEWKQQGEKPPVRGKRDLAEGVGAMGMDRAAGWSTALQTGPWKSHCAATQHHCA